MISDAGDGRLRVMRVIARMNVGGPARQVTSLARAMDVARFDHRIYVGSVGDDEIDDLDERAADVAHTRIPGLGRSPQPLDDLRALSALVREMRRFRPHVVHTHTAKAGTLGRVAAVIASRLDGVARPLVVHTFHGHLLHGYFSRPVTRAVVEAERRFARVTDRLVAVGERVRDELVDAGVAPPEAFVVVPPGIDIGPLPARADARDRLGLRATSTVVTFMGRLIPVKRVDRFLDAATQVARDRPDLDLQFLVVGDGPDACRVRERVGEIDAVATGWVSDVEHVVAATDLMVLTSDNEGMPVALIEAALAGVPAVSTDVGSAAEVVVSGLTGLVVEPSAAAVAAAIAALAGDRDRRMEMGRRAAERARAKFSAARLVADTEALYEALCSRSNRSVMS